MIKAAEQSSNGRVIGYIRVSTDQQATDGVSLDAQAEKIKAWADLNGFDDVMLFDDAGISGKRSDNRPGLQAALDELTAGDALVVYSLSRLARSTKDTIEIAERLEQIGADLVSLSEKIDTTTAAGKMVFRMLAVLSEFERDQVSERTRAALQHKRRQGHKTGGDVPYGYRLSNESGRLAPEDSEQRAIRMMRKLHRQGFSLRHIGRRLQEKGYTTRRGKTNWHPKTIDAILKREAATA